MDSPTPPRNSDRPTEATARVSTAKTFPVHLHHRHRSESRPARDSAERQHWSRRLFIDTSDFELDKNNSNSSNSNNNSHSNSHSIPNANSSSNSQSHQSHHGGRHRHSRSRDHRLPRAVNQIASAGGARNLLPSRTFHRGDKDKDASDDNFLKPAATLDSSRSAQSSRSTSAHNDTGESGKSSPAASNDLSRKLALANLREVKTMADLEEVRKRREKGEEALRTKVSSVGSLAADITRRLDYSYYNLLERVSALYSTIRAFQELVDSSSSLQADFARDSGNLEQDFRKQLGEFHEFCPQIDRIDALEKRMSAGRSKMEALRHRLDRVRQEIEGWERRETEWQARVTRRLRLFWAIIITATLFVVIAYVIQEWPDNVSWSSAETLLSGQPVASLTSQRIHQAAEEMPSILPELSDNEVESLLPPLPSPSTTSSASTTSQSVRSQSDPLRLFDEL